MYLNYVKKAIQRGKKLKKKETKRKRLKPISLYPLKPEKALSLFMRVDPGKVGKGALSSA